MLPTVEKKRSPGQYLVDGIRRGGGLGGLLGMMHDNPSAQDLPERNPLSMDRSLQAGNGWFGEACFPSVNRGLTLIRFAHDALHNLACTRTNQSDFSPAGQRRAKGAHDFHTLARSA